MNNGTKITFGMLAAIIAAKARTGSRYRDQNFEIDEQFITKVSGIPQSEWYMTIDKPFDDQKVMDMLTRNMFINSIDFYNDNMVFVAENIGQFINPSLDPIAYYLKQINQPGVSIITSNQMDIKKWLRNNANESFSPEAYEDIDSRLLFMIKLDSPELPLSLETSYLIADTVGPQLYHDVWYNMTM